MFIQWNENTHSLGIAQIDEQHKELFLITNQIYEESEKNASGPNYIPMLKRLYAYSKYHFSSEEGLFIKYKFPDRVGHEAVHKSFTARIKEYLEDFRQKPNKPADELTDFLIDWIINHIQGEDKKYAVFFMENGIECRTHFSPLKEGSKALDTAANKLWTEKKLQTDIKAIDAQHKELVFILQQFNDLQTASESRRRAFTPGFIKRLFYYSQYHFGYEEELMAKYRYPDILPHRELHYDFVMRIKDFAREYGLNKESLNDEIIFFLKDWIISHILGEDSKYKSYIRI